MQSILLGFVLLFAVMVCVSSDTSKAIATTQLSDPTTKPTPVTSNSTSPLPTSQPLMTTASPTPVASNSTSPLPTSPPLTTTALPTPVTSNSTSPLPTSQALTTTASPTPMPIGANETVNDYTSSENNTICLMARFSAHFQMDEMVWNVSKGAFVDNTTSTCRILSVTFGHSMNFLIVFNRTDKDAFYISEVHAVLGEVQPSSVNMTRAKTSSGSSYMCTSGIEIPLSKNVTLYMKEVQLQAYGVQDGKFGTAQKCNSDLSPLVPIIVGAILAGLIVIVIVAYFIGKRRNRTGYEEI